MANRTSTAGLIVHHSGGNEPNPQALRDVFRNKHGFPKIGYHVAIWPDGSFAQDMPWQEWGAHNNTGSVNNSNSVGIAFVGDFTGKLPTPAALATFRRKASEFQSWFGKRLEWQKTVWGHRDHQATACPGNALYGYLPELVKSINETEMDQENQNYRTFAKEVQAGSPQLIRVEGTDPVRLIYHIPSYEHADFVDPQLRESIALMPAGTPENPADWGKYVQSLQDEIKTLKSAASKPVEGPKTASKDPMLQLLEEIKSYILSK